MTIKQTVHFHNLWSRFLSLNLFVFLCSSSWVMFSYDMGLSSQFYQQIILADYLNKDLRNYCVGTGTEQISCEFAVTLSHRVLLSANHLFTSTHT